MAVYKLQQKNSEGTWVDVTLGKGPDADDAFVSQEDVYRNCICGFAWVTLEVTDYGKYQVAIPINALFYQSLTEGKYDQFLGNISWLYPWPVMCSLRKSGNELEIAGVVINHIVTPDNTRIAATYVDHVSFFFPQGFRTN